MKKYLLFMVLVLVSVMGFAGGSDQKSAGGKTELRLWVGSWWEAKAPGIKADFEAAYPQYNLIIDCQPINGYYDNAATSIISGSPPDMLDMATAQVASFASRNLLTDVTASIGTKLTASDFMKPAWDASWYQGKLYGIPSRGYGEVYYYNKTLFDEAGVPYPTDNWTYADLLQIAQKITVRGKHYGLGIAADASNPGNIWSSFAPILWAFGGEFMSPDNKQCLLNTPGSIAGITFWTELYTKHKVVPEGTLNYTVSRDLLGQFAQNQIAMVTFNVEGINVFSATPGLRWGIVQSPSGFTRAEGATMTIPATSPRAKDAENFLLWFSKAEVQAKHMPVEPANIAAWQMAPPWNDPEHEQIAIAGNHGKMLPVFGAWSQAIPVIISELQLILEGRKTPKEGADSMVTRINQLL
jgi:multiple sugar transport system substrate-binding protein